MLSIQTLVAECNTILQPHLFKDFGPNGLQVLGDRPIRHLVSGVTASLALIDQAIAQEADALLVHHGLFWQGDDPCVVGWKQVRLKRLLTQGVHLVAYHLPLDAHRQWGNNVQLGHRLGLEVSDWFISDFGPEIGCIGHLPSPISARAWGEQIAQKLGRVPTVLKARSTAIQTVAWCTGGAQKYLPQAAAKGVDAYLTGEISEVTLHLAQELGIDFIAAGHHATERYGAQALGGYLAEHFQIQHTFIDVENPA